MIDEQLICCELLLEDFSVIIGLKITVIKIKKIQLMLIK